jgi:hypothetical protein
MSRHTKHAKRLAKEAGRGEEFARELAQAKTRDAIDPEARWQDMTDLPVFQEFMRKAEGAPDA